MYTFCCKFLYVCFANVRRKTSLFALIKINVVKIVAHKSAYAI